MNRVARSLLWRAFSSAASSQKQQAVPSCLAAMQQVSSEVLAGPSASSMASIAQFSRRGLFTSSGTLSSLPTILDQELQHEKEHYEKPEAIAQGPPAPFTLTETPQDTLMTLSRSYGEGEDIDIDLHVNQQPGVEESDDPEEEVLSTVVFNVHVNKGDKSLVFECESDGTFVGINHISFEPKSGVPSDSYYTGPVFDELDEELQSQFRSYLQERGVTPELGEYLRHLVYDKEVREYTAWLQSVHGFVGKK